MAVDVPVPHLDRPFDYLVPERLSAAAVPGARVRVRLAGKQVDAYVLARCQTSEHAGRLVPIGRVVSAEPVLTPEVLRLARTVADYYAGTLSDVLRLAIPPRHAAAEEEDQRQAEQENGGPRTPTPPPVPQPIESSVWQPYPAGPAFVRRLAEGDAPWAVWTALPGPGWASAVAQALLVVARSGRGAVAVVPDHRDLDLLGTALGTVARPHEYVRLAADLGARARYAAFLRALRGQARIVIGTRAAMFAPVADLGLLVLWDDGDDQHAEPRAPYPHARQVLALRARLAGCALLVGGWSRTPQAQLWLRSGTAREIAADRTGRRSAWPRIVVAPDGLADDPVGRAARLPRQAFEAIRTGLARGPVLVQVPRGGYLPALACQDCRHPARCGTCAAALRLGSAGADLACPACGRVVTGWQCPKCGSSRLRARAVGVERTADELGRAFPGSRVVVSRPERHLPQVGGAPGTLVLATPGVEPIAESPYAVGVLLDGDLLLARPDLRAGEEALRRWLGATALVRAADAGGVVVVCADSGAAAVGALVRVDPAAFADRELDERQELGLPPTVVTASVTGPSTAVEAFTAALALPPGALAFGPVPVDPGSFRMVVRAPLAARHELTKALRDGVVARSLRKEEATVRVRVDALDIG